MPFAAKWMQLEVIILSEISQKDRQLPYITYTWNLKYDTNEHIYEAETDTESRLVVAKGERVGEEWAESLGLADANKWI